MCKSPPSRRLVPRRKGIRNIAVASSLLVGALVSAAPAGAAPAVASAPGAGPSGPGGAWTSVFDDEFNGNSLDTSHWTPNEGGHINNVTTHAANTTEGGGHLTLTLAGPGSGATINSDVPGGYHLAVGQYVEASVLFHGSGNQINDWPAWWVSGPNWPSAGENDIAEGLAGDGLTVNYHSPSGSHNQGSVPGVWSNAYHTYGVYRAANHADVYWDGKLVKSYPTDDNGQPESLIFNVGGSGVYGASSQVLVDWVRAWAPRAGVSPGVPAMVARPSQAPWWATFWNGMGTWFRGPTRTLFDG